MTQENPGNALAIVENIESYPALRAPAEVAESLEIIKEALGGARLSVFSDLTRITVPSGGATKWEIRDVTAKGGVRSVDTISGIIISNQYSRGYWEKPYGGADSGPPDCSSWEMDSYGMGVPGGECFSCQFNQFNTAAQGTGKACSEKRFLFMLTTDSLLPTVVQVPVTSIKPYTQFSVDVGSKMRLRPRQIVVDLSLKRESKSGFPTAIIVPSVNARLADEDCLKVLAWIEIIAPIMPGRTTPRTEVSEEEEFLDDDPLAGNPSDDDSPFEEGEPSTRA